MQPPDQGASNPRRRRSESNSRRTGKPERRGGPAAGKRKPKYDGPRAVDVQAPVAKGEPGFQANRELLERVSRTFYLTIQRLPESVREPVGLGYLVARATDTIADSAKGEPAERILWLQGYVALFKYGWDPAFCKKMRAAVAPEIQDEGERELIESTEMLVAWFQEQPNFERCELLRVWSRIAYAQEQDLRCFGDGKSLQAIPNAEGVETYTYLIAGCVGEFWTRLCQERCDDFSRQPLTSMEEKGRSFGQALQLINILRDFGADLSEGRCYLPEQELKEAGVSLDHLKSDPSAGRDVIAAWRKRAWQLLSEASDYVLAIENPTLRLATALPVAIGSRTLRLLEDETAAVSGGAKLSRQQIKWLLAQGLIANRVRPLLPKFLGV